MGGPQPHAASASLDRVVLLTGDLLEPISEPLDVVAANLPYIPTDEYERLPDEIRAAEPRLAVDGGDDRPSLRARPPPLSTSSPTTWPRARSPSCLNSAAASQAFVGDWVTTALGGADAGVRDIEVHRDLAGNRRVLEVRRGY